MNKRKPSSLQLGIYDIVLACLGGDDERGWTPFFHFVRPQAAKLASTIRGPLRQDALEEFPPFVVSEIYTRWRSAKLRGVATDPVSGLRKMLEAIRAAGDDEEDAARAFLYESIRMFQLSKYIETASKGRMYRPEDVLEDESNVETETEDRELPSKQPDKKGNKIKKEKEYLQQVSIGGVFYSNNEEIRVPDLLDISAHEQWAIEQREDPGRLKETFLTLRPLIGELRDTHRVPLRLRCYPLLQDLEDRDLEFLAARQAPLAEEVRLFDVAAPITVIRERVLELLDASTAGKDTTPHDLTARLMDMTENTANVYYLRACKQLTKWREARHAD